MPRQIKINPGDTLSAIAEREGSSVQEIFDINQKNPSVRTKDLIIAGGTINIPTALDTTPEAITEDIPGLGTLKRIKKEPLEASPDVGVPITEDVITPGADEIPTGEVPTDEAGVPIDIPTFGPREEKPPVDITQSFQDVSDRIDQISKDILASKTPTPEEKQLLKDLQEKKASLRTFDLETLQRVESFVGTGRGRTTAFVGKQQAKERRVRALERLGLAQEAQSLTELLGLEETERRALGDIATTQLSLAGKKLDLALGLKSEFDKLNEKEQDDARAFILDVIDFSQGKTFEELDPGVQQQIINSVADSPLTLSMVKTALESGAKEEDRILSVAEAKSLGVPFGTKMSEAFGKVPLDKDRDALNPGGYNDAELRKLRGSGIDALNITEADEFLYGGATRSDRQDLKDSGIETSDEPVQTYFLNTPSAFREQYNREVSAGSRKPSETLEDISSSYQKWYDEKKSSSTRDWGSLLD